MKNLAVALFCLAASACAPIGYQVRGDEVTRCEVSREKGEQCERWADLNDPGRHDHTPDAAYRRAHPVYSDETAAEAMITSARVRSGK